MIIGSTPRIIIAGLAAYLSGSLVNARVMSRMKIKSNDGKKFGLRAIVSTLVGETIDSGVFVPIAFGGLISVGQILNMIMVRNFKNVVRMHLPSFNSCYCKKSKGT